MESEFRTKDFYHAVVLKAFGWLLVQVVPGEGKFSVFVFDDPDNKAEECIRDYWERKLVVDPRLMVEVINELKTRLYSRI